jgi:hypothetical protein
VESPEFKPQYCQQKTKTKTEGEKEEADLNTRKQL